MTKQNVHIAVLMMVRNEEKYISVSLESIKGFADSLIIFDTGSTDNTIKILTDFCNESNISLRLKEGVFVDFSTSRNVSLDFADTFDDVDYITLLDCNDQLRGGDSLREYCTKNWDEPCTGFLLCQEWLSASLDKYYNMRLIKAREGWRYRGSVHEWLKNTKVENNKEPPVYRIPSDIVLYQNRNEDDGKSGDRFSRDKPLLLRDHMDNPKEPRTLFYLAQTCSCLNQNDEALYYYKLRQKVEGFQEEKFHAYLRAGEISEKLGHDWSDSMKWYIKAFEHSSRAEPLIKITEHYKWVADMQIKLSPDNLDHHRVMNNWILAFTFADMACKLTYPDYCLLFVNKQDYEYKRWHLMGVCAYYAGFFKEGKIACNKAIDAGCNLELDNMNLRAYLDAEKLDNDVAPCKTKISKKYFLDKESNKIRKENPGLTLKQCASKANKKWKSEKINR